MNRFAAVQLSLAVMLFFFCQLLDLHSCPESLGVICVSLSGCFRGRYYKEHNSQSQFSEIRMIPAGRDDKRTMLYKLCLVQVSELQRVLCCMKVLLGPLLSDDGQVFQRQTITSDDKKHRIHVWIKSVDLMKGLVRLKLIRFGEI